jgi:hypothetical protein
MAYTPAFVTLSLCLSVGLVTLGDANAFLKANPSSKEQRISEQEVQTSLLAEVEGTFGEGTASSRVKQLEATLRPMYAALPKNEQGYLGHATVRYALHRLFVQRHGWFIKGLDVAGGHRNTTSDAGLLKEHVPAYVQDLFEKRLGGRGFGLHELGVLAATIEHLVHTETIKRLGDAFRVHDYLPTSLMSESEADEVLDTYMTSYLLGEDLSNATLQEALEFKAEMPEVYMAWNDTQEFVRAVRRNITESDGSAEQKASGGFEFSLVARVAERVGERFGSFQFHECQQIKTSLMKMEESDTGRVALSDFYKPAVNGHWQFQENVGYLRQLGALDESDPARPRVIIPNYVISPSNCIASSSFYSVCCMDECEDLLGHLERQIAAPEATPARISNLVGELSSSSVAAPRKLSASLLDRLEDIATGHGGSIPLHGRLFAQWMHHAFPRECPYPHVSGTTNPQNPDEWEAMGQETTATDEEMQFHVDNALNSTRQEQLEVAPLPWSPEEELLVCRPPTVTEGPAGTSLFASARSAMLFMAMVSIAYGLVRNSRGSADVSGGLSAEKLNV